MDYSANKPTGSDAESVFHQETWEQTRGERNRLRSTSTAWFEFTPRGIFAHARPGKSSAPQPVQTKLLTIGVGSGFQFSDYIVTKEGVAVAKPYKIRCSVKQTTILGTKFDLAYPHNPNGGGPSADDLAYIYRTQNFHNAGPGSVPEYQIINPEFCDGDEITAIKIPTSVMSDPLDTVTSKNGKSVAIEWALFSPQSYAWTALSVQQPL